MSLNLKQHALQAVSSSLAPRIETFTEQGYAPRDLASLLWAQIPKMGIKRASQILKGFHGDDLWHLFWVPPQWAKMHFSESFHHFPKTLLTAWEERQAYFKDHLDALVQKYKNADVGWINIGDDAYPQLLKEIHDAPAHLFYRGNLDLLTSGTRFVSVVGTRQASTYGLDHTASFIAGLQGHDVCIVSGMAMGIDSAAHQAALNAGLPTIAVLAGGLDHVYPSSNEKMAKGIIESGGLLLSEMPLGVPPVPKLFPRRNRIIVGLSPLLWIVEADLRSGSMVSARIALEENRDIVVLPMHIGSLGSQGPLKLLREGASPMTEPCHLLDSLGIIDIPMSTSMDATETPESVSPPQNLKIRQDIPTPHKTPHKEIKSIQAFSTPPPLSKDVSPEVVVEVEHPVVLALVKHQTKSLSVDTLASQLNITHWDLFADLSVLEIEGKIKRQAGNIIELVAS